MVDPHDFGDAAAAGIKIRGWGGMSKDGHGEGEAERVCRMLRGKNALRCTGIIRVSKSDGRRIDGG